MRHLFSDEGRYALSQRSSSDALVALDYDGTLSPIVPDPSSAMMRGRTRELLTEVSRLYSCIVLSGRAQLDVSRRLAGIGLREILGNHGIEPWQGGRRFAEDVQSWEPVLAAHLAGCRGVTIEHKVFSIALHYRNARDRKKALRAIRTAVGCLHGARVLGGKEVINLLPYGSPHKGVALEKALRRLGCTTAIYVGDDESDEDVFRHAAAERLLTIRIGECDSSKAAFYLRDQHEVDELLELLAQEGSRW